MKNAEVDTVVLDPRGYREDLQQQVINLKERCQNLIGQIEDAGDMLVKEQAGRAKAEEHITTLNEALHGEILARERAEENLKAAVEVIEELVEKGVSVERARNAVSKAVEEGGDRIRLRQMLDSDAISEMIRETTRERTRTNEDIDAERAQKENMGESKGPKTDTEKQREKHKKP